MKKNIALIISIIAFLVAIMSVLCSCTSSGKLTDAEFPYKFKYNPEHGTILNAGQIITYNGSATVPTAAGSYSVKGDSYGNKSQSDTIKYVLIFLGIVLSIVLAVFLFIRNRDEEITMPDDEDDNFPPLDNAFGINNSIFKL